MDNNKYLGKMLDGRYEIMEVIGKGGMAYVFKARCHLLNRFVAIKMLREDMATDASFRDNFKKEAQAVAMLSHPNIMSIYDVSRTPDMDYIVMELIEGITLKMYMKTKGVLSCKESVHFATQIAKALSHAHTKGIVHRDIKPQNIMIAMDGAVKVTDFGIAHLENAATAESMAVGSVHYISPEQAKGQAVDHRSDIYSLGIVMYEMLTGCLPFTGDTAESVALQHVSAVPKPLREINSDIPEELEAITLKAMNADIDERYQSVDELLEDLNEYRLSSTGTVPVVQQPVVVESVSRADAIPANVAPLSRSGELSKESYARRQRRAKRVSMLSGIVLVLLFIVAVFVFLWNYWLAELFAEPVRINIPSFVGSTYEELLNNKDFQSIYNFTRVYAVDANAEAGVIIAQEPAAGKSIMQDSDGIDVVLTISTGTQMIPVPDVVNMEYREAVLTLQKEGFVPDISYETSPDITEDYVIYTSPEAGDSLPAGSIVYLTVSSGPVVVTLQMPNLVGLTRSSAVSKIESCNLVVGSITYVDDDMPAGTVIWQSIDAYTTVEEHEKVYLQISNGPKETEPEESEAPSGGDNTESSATDLQPEAPTNGG